MYGNVITIDGDHICLTGIRSKLMSRSSTPPSAPPVTQDISTQIDCLRQARPYRDEFLTGSDRSCSCSGIIWRRDTRNAVQDLARALGRSRTDDRSHRLRGPTGSGRLGPGGGALLPAHALVRSGRSAFRSATAVPGIPEQALDEPWVKRRPLGQREELSRTSTGTGRTGSSQQPGHRHRWRPGFLPRHPYPGR